MKHIKFSHKVMAMTLLLAFSPSLIPINHVFASNNGPTAPEAASFEPVDATDMVNLVTGDFSYVLPLLNVPSPEGGYPLALSYHAGIGLDQEASWVGLGWNLNPGAINRNVSGVPDDWLETKKYSMMYNDIGVARNISLGINPRIVGLASFAASLNYSSFKATGGETTHDVGLSFSADVLSLGNGKGILGVSGYLGTNGVGLGGNLGYGTENSQMLGAGLYAFQSFRGEGYRIGSNVSYNRLGVGIDLSSKSGLSSSASLGGGNINLIGGDNLNSAINQQKSGFLLDFYFINFSYFKTKYWLFDASYSIYNGSLYSGKINDTYQNLTDPSKLGLDSYESTFEADTDNQLREANFSFISYDNYNINAQGIGGSMSPKLLENGSLVMPLNTIRTRKSAHGRYQVSLTNTTYLKPDSDSRNFSKSLDEKNVHFYLDNEYSSYLEIGSDDWSTPFSSNTYGDLTDISFINRTFNDTKEIHGKSYDSYDETSGRLKKGNYIETFTNADIAQFPSKIIQPIATGFNRTSPSVPEKGIGAFKVTALDGKTYHYSLPVYQKEQFTRISNVEDDSEDKFLEQQQFEPYATHWLLTAITGPDYFDKNGNDVVDEGDYGYWASFEYGKWSDGFAWRSPNEDFRSNGTSNSYSWGIKEVYYLDKIKTRTHTALFVKEPREDNKSYQDKISNGNSARHYYIPSERSIIRADDGRYFSQGTHLDIEIRDGLWQNYYSTSDFWIYADLVEQRSLRLDKIILLKNEDANGVRKYNSDDVSSKFAGRMYAEAEVTLFSITAARVNSNREFIDDDHTWQGEYYDYVLNTNDIDVSALTKKSLKTIDFHYDEAYPLGRKASQSKGKLTLNSVDFIGRQGVKLMPPYSFEYFSPNTIYTEDNVDDWGYFKDNAMIWSLDKIKNPIGGEIEIIYENDRYFNEYASPRTFFASGLEFKYGGTISGPKTLSFRNDANVAKKYQVDFTKYFTAGQSTEVDAQFWHFTRTNSNWIADVAADCMVKSVSKNLIVFEIPAVNQSWGRENSDCSKKDWVYYDGQYNHVVDETVGWIKHNNENSCERPEERHNRSRYKIFAQKEPLNNSIGGGVRVKELIVSGEGHSTKTIYNYSNSQGNETGVTSYALSKRNRVIPYISELPGPMVLYGNVTSEKRDANGNLTFKKDYVFDVPKPIQYLSNGVFIENALKIEVEQDASYTDISVNNENVDVQLARFKVSDYSGNIGRLQSSQEYNPQGQLLRKVKNTYKAHDFSHDQGILKETFSSYKVLRDYPLKDKYIMTSSSKLKIPSAFSKATIIANGFEQEQEIIQYDFLTGLPLQTTIKDSENREVKTTAVPAYTKYPAMGSLVDMPDNAISTYKNMLAQTAMNITEIKSSNEKWQKIASNITTWKPQGYTTTINSGNPPNPVPIHSTTDVWHKHKIYTWNGATDDNGHFLDYSLTDNSDGFDWSDSNAEQPFQWKILSEITKYNDFSATLEVMGLNGNYASTKMGDGDSKIFVTGNAGYNELFYSGAEDLDMDTSFYGGEVGKGTASEIPDYAHTGEKSLQIKSGQEGYNVQVTEGKSDQYKVSLWAKYGTHTNVILNVEGQSEITHSPNELVQAGDWVQLNFYFTLKGTKTVSVGSSNGSVIVDDFRLHPVNASITSYVYNEWDELTHIIGPNNLAVKYRYDEMGRLEQTLTEVADFKGPGSGGFKPTTEHEYTYKY